MLDSPRIAFSNVDLPDPTGPTIMVRVERRTATLTLLRIVSFPSLAETQASRIVIASLPFEPVAGIDCNSVSSTTPARQLCVDFESSSGTVVVQLSLLSWVRRNVWIRSKQARPATMVGYAAMRLTTGVETRETIDKVVKASATPRFPLLLVRKTAAAMMIMYVS